MSAEPREPQERLDPGVRILWRLQHALQGGFATIAGAVVSGPVLDGTLATLVWTAPLLLGAVALVVLPPLRYARWRFDVSEEEIDLRHGVFDLHRTLVPMRRVQHVDSTSGVLEQLLSLSTVVIHTAGGEVSIPGLEQDRALWLHERIAGLARLTDDD